MAVKTPADQQLLKTWYCKDTNAEPNVYVLQPLTDRLEHFSEESADKALVRRQGMLTWIRAVLVWASFVYGLMCHLEYGCICHRYNALHRSQPMAFRVHPNEICAPPGQCLPSCCNERGASSTIRIVTTRPRWVLSALTRAFLGTPGGGCSRSPSLSRTQRSRKVF